MEALERSREDLRDSLERIGDTLTSTHDLDGLLQVVLETAVVTLQGRSGVVLRMSTDRLQLVASTGWTRPGCRHRRSSHRAPACSARSCPAARACAAGWVPGRPS